MAQHEAAAAATGEAARQKEAQRRMQPRTRADFLVLYDELAVWCAVECLGQGHVGCLAGWGLNGQCGNIGSIVSNSAFVLQCIKLLTCHQCRWGQEQAKIAAAQGLTGEPASLP